MIDIVYSPQWFYGKDIIIDAVSALVLFLIAFFSIRYYKTGAANKNYLALAGSFSLIALSFLFKILTNFTIYYRVLETKQFGFVTFTYNAVRSSDLFFFVGFLMYRILTLCGLYILYSIYQKQSKSTIFIALYLILALTYFSTSAYYIFHITSMIFLILITVQYFRNYRKSRHKITRSLAYSFGLITVSQIFFVFIRLNLALYAVAEIIQLIGYAGLLITFIMVLRHGKETRQN